MDTNPATAHSGMIEYSGLPGGMREFYNKLGVYATSTHGDTMLIRSHIAYVAGCERANRAVIKPSRGHTYRVDGAIARITDYYDHRDGVKIA